MSYNRVILVFLSFCILALSGCVSSAKKDNFPNSTSNLLEPSATLKFSDLPVPAGFKLLPQNSYSFESTGVRVGVLKYRGKANIEQVINFYKEQMPMYNWDLINMVEYGERLLNFERENETCIISLFPKGNNITITLSLGPKSQIIKKTKTSLK